MSGIIHKVKEAVHSDNKAHHGAPEGTHGPHRTGVANALDPRVDSDRDQSTTIGTGRTAGHGEYDSSSFGTGTAEGTHGLHGSRVANTLDPRVDSDRDQSTAIDTGRTSGTSEGTYGPHSSRLANAADPRVDSDRDNSVTFGAGNTGTTGFSSTHHTAGAGLGATSMTGTHGAPARTYDPHGSSLANPAHSDRHGRGAIGTGPGPAPNTAGPHKSDIANKMDPHVDSDIDNSRTVGGNKTYQPGDTSTYRDPTDAAQVPPSVLRRHVGVPSIEHGDATHHRERRNSIKTDQETFRGV